MAQSEQQAANQRIDESVVIPVITEEVNVGKRVIETGRVQISKEVHQEEIAINVPLLREEVNVERVAINQFVQSPPAIRHQGETLIIPVLREEVVTEKRLVLVEELHVTKRQVQHNASQQVTLRKEEVTVTRIDSDHANPSGV